MGNSRWRLETSINLTVLNAKEANFLNNLEIIVSDWGSDVPLSDALILIPETRGVVKFVHIPQKVAIVEQKDSKFPEVIALNTAARQATGEFIGRIDNDTIVGTDFFRNFLSLCNQNSSDSLDLDDSFLFVERRSVPFRISSKSLPLNQIKWFVQTFQNFLTVETATDWGKEFWHSPVGIMMFNRDIWMAAQGYDESLIYWGWMEGDLALRLGQKHKIIEFSKYVGYHLYHLEHYSNLTEYKDRNGAATPRKKNQPKFNGLRYTVNSSSWGLDQLNLKLVDYNPKSFRGGNFMIGFYKLFVGILLLLKDKIEEESRKFHSTAKIFLGRFNPLK
jgi:hypothetical protein